MGLRRLSLILLIFIFSQSAFSEDVIPKTQSVNHLTVHLEIPKNQNTEKTDLVITQTWWQLSDLNFNESDGVSLSELEKSLDADVVEFVIDKKNRSPQSESKILNYLRNKFQKAETHKIKDVTHSGLFKAISKIGSFVSGLRETVRDRYVPPVKEQVVIGVINTLYRGVSSSLIWFSGAAVSPEVAMCLTTFQTATTALFSIYGVTVERVFYKNFKALSGNVTDASYSRRRTLYSFVSNSIIALMSGELDSKQTLQNLLRAFVNSIITAPGDTALSKVSYKTFLNNSETPQPSKKELSLYSRLGALTFLIFAPIGLLEMTGSFGTTLMDLHFYEFKTTTLALIVAYMSSYLVIKKLPGPITRLLEWPDTFLEKVGIKKKNLPPLFFEGSEVGAKGHCNEKLEANKRDPTSINTKECK